MRLLSTLFAALFVAAAFAGCFHGDEDDDDGGDTGNGNGGNGNGNNNTTNGNETDQNETVEMPPTASITLRDGTNETNVIFVNGETNATKTVTLDASNSTDADGNITVYAWLVTGPKDFEFKDQNQTTTLSLSDKDGYGIYLVRLTVIDDDNLVGTANTTLYVGYDITREVTLATRVPNPAVPPGPTTGQGQRPEPNDSSCGDTACHVHTVSLAANATSAEFTLTWASGEIVSPGGTMAMWVFSPSDTELAQVSGGSPLATTVTADKLNATGQYKAEAHIDGTSDATGLTYTFRAVIRYDPV